MEFPIAGAPVAVAHLLTQHYLIGSREHQTTVINVFLIVIRFFLPGIVFMYTYFITGLISALIYLLFIRVWGLRKNWPTSRSGEFLSYSISLTLIILLCITIHTESRKILHLYGILWVTWTFYQMASKTSSNLITENSIGAMVRIQTVSTLIISYFLIIAVSEVLWASGGIDHWIWILAFATTISFLGVIFAHLFLILFLEAVNDTSKSIR